MQVLVSDFLDIERQRNQDIATDSYHNPNGRVRRLLARDHGRGRRGRGQGMDGGSFATTAAVNDDEYYMIFVDIFFFQISNRRRARQRGWLATSPVGRLLRVSINDEATRETGKNCCKNRIQHDKPQYRAICSKIDKWQSPVGKENVGLVSGTAY